MAPRSSMSILTTSGRTSGGGGFPTGMLRLTECSWIGIVMISMTSSTSMTSISGVVLMSSMTSPSPPWPPLVPTFIAMFAPRDLPGSSAAAARRRLGDESDLGYARALAGVDDAADRLVLGAAVAADLHLRLRREHRYLLQPLDQRGRRRDAQVVPVNAILQIDREDDVLRLGLANLVALFGQLHRNRRRDDRDRYQEDDQQHQHDVDQRRGVDRRDDLVLVCARRTDAHRHGIRPWPERQRLSGRSAARHEDRRRSCAPGPSPPCCGGSASCNPEPPERRLPGRTPS